MAKPLSLAFSNATAACIRRLPQISPRGRYRPLYVGKVDFHSDGLRGYNGLVDLGYAKHLRVDHGGHEFVSGHNYRNENLYKRLLKREYLKRHRKKPK